MPIDLLPYRAGELDPAKQVVIRCRSGNRSLAAAEVLMANGFSDARSLAGGLIAWVEARQDLVQ